ncbi:ZinT/AdcA family metal-binding protein, partial [Streptomyces sp. URMC 126]|uniref:ZinT/AdcA family metal-binding protein n=1 Tax=Streptomyces sp. URMC 126 TaxID=3423401 RepID=UPI003F194A4B
THDHSHDHGHSHDHDHGHDHDNASTESSSDGYFQDEQVQPRPLSDWTGEWQSVYPYLLDGTLDPVLAHKAQKGDKTVAEYQAYYEAGYR